MASQIAHIIYARKYFEKHPSTINKDEFMLGCVFPDIRRIDETIKRKDTHLHFGELNLDFTGLSAFEAGWKFHLYCDMCREDILNKHGFYALKNTADFYHQPAKMLEDEIAYDEYNNWEKLVNYFNNVPFINAGIGVTRETWELWYAMIAKYAERKPDSKSISAFLIKQRKIENTAEIVATVDKLRKNAKVVEILKKVTEEIV